MAENIKKITEISGFGKDTDYEEACQTMLQAGYEWLVQHGKEADLKANTIKNAYGILIPKSEDAKALSEAIAKVVPDCSGAMHQAVMGHLFAINRVGLTAWKKEVTKQPKGEN